MIKKTDLISKVDKYNNIFNSFISKYKIDPQQKNVERVPILLNKIKQNIKSSSISDKFYERIDSLLEMLEVNKLVDPIEKNDKEHDFELYRNVFDKTLIHSYFASEIFNLFASIGFVNSNIVIVGANGCGKTLFADNIRETLGKMDSGIVIPAQKLLILPTFEYIPNHKITYGEYLKRQKENFDDKTTFTVKSNDDYPYSIAKQYSGDMALLISNLLSEKITKNTEYCEKIKDGDFVSRSHFRSTLDNVIDIWNEVIQDRTLTYDSSYNLKIKYGDSTYSAYMMSDGEREILYVLGRVLLSPAESLIIVDEPELHLHKSISNKLWDIIESKCRDRIFIYLTHDIDFASSRNAKKYWLKSCSLEDIIKKWDFQPIPENDIPEELLMKILGSRKKILFCEGNETNSLDSKIFEMLFPQYTIVPLLTCKNVIDYTKAFNKIKNKYSEAYGLIDHDFREETQLKKLKANNIYSYKVAEIENLFLLEDFIIGYASYKHEYCNIEDIKTEILKRFHKDIDLQASNYVTNTINYIFNESHLEKSNTKEKLNVNYKNFTSKIDIESLYQRRYDEINDIYNKNDYKRAILYYNNKGLHTVVERKINISNYIKRAIQYLKYSDEAKALLRKEFPSELTNNINYNTY
jgi:hypothetical protein